MDKLREYLWLSDLSEDDMKEVERYVFYVNSSRIGVEKQRLHEEAVGRTGSECSPSHNGHTPGDRHQNQH